MSPTPKRSCRGVSVLEGLVAIGLTGILAAVGIPTMTRLRAPYALSGAVHQVAADLQLARRRAIARNTRYRLNFASGSSYTIERETAPNTWAVDGSTQHLPSGTSVGSVTPGNPVFDSRGMVPALVTIPVMRTGKTKVISLNVLGQATID